MSQGEYKEKEKEKKLVEATEDCDLNPVSTSEEPEDLVGKTIGGHYRVLSKLGIGGMSTVYRVHHEHLDRELAIKFIQKKYVHDPLTVSRFKQEAKAAAALEHENICGVKEFEILEDGTAFLVMDYIEGKSLSDLLKEEGKLSFERTLNIMAQVANALAYAHTKGVIHRDVKPANIILVKNADGTETARLVDFGIAKLVRDDDVGPDLTQTGEVVGTPNYMSPEQCYGEKIDSKTDIYSFACVLFELLSGKPPFVGTSSLDIIMKHVNEEPPKLKLDRNSNEVNSILRKCLKKSASDRYETFQLVEEDLKAVLSQEAPPNIDHRSESLIRLRRRFELFIIPVALILIAFCGFQFCANSLNQMEYQNKWKKVYATAEQKLEAKKYAQAEVSLEEALVLARKSRNQGMIALTLKDLHDVEMKLGKEDEASRHQAKQNVFVETLKAFFMNIAWILILIGVGIFVLFVFLFGPGGYITKRFSREEQKELNSFFEKGNKK